MFITNYADNAREDIREAAQWYSIQKPGLEDEFLESLYLSVRYLTENPYHYQQYFRQVRSVVLKRFPYRVVYKIEGNALIILAVLHTSRNPKLIRKRLK
jgi:toxin ParE1/3/4